MTARWILLLLWTACLSLAGCRLGREPNVLLIVMDTTRRDRLSCYGYQKPTTPHLDRIAAQGLLYENCISAAPWTLPSHATLFTGLYPRDHHAVCESPRLAEQFTTLAEVLDQAGYQTVGFSNNVWLGKGGLKQGFSEFFELWREHSESQHPDEGAALTNRKVLRWLDRRIEPTRPFFLFINYMEPHLPYRAPFGYDRPFLPNRADPAKVEAVRAWQHPRELGYILKQPGMELSQEQLELLQAEYDGEIAYLDFRIGQLVAELRRRRLLERTIVILTSDHGEHLGEHGLMDHKMSVYDQLIRVPLILSYPPALPRGARVRTAVQTNDIFPTILKLCRLERELPNGSAPLPFEDRAGAGRQTTFAEFGNPVPFLAVMHKVFPGVDYGRFDRSLKVVRGPRYKYIWSSDHRPELYDLASDPEERDNLAGSHPAAVKRLHARLTAFNRAAHRSAGER